jgi:hypothetical protein
VKPTKRRPGGWPWAADRPHRPGHRRVGPRRRLRQSACGRGR